MTSGRTALDQGGACLLLTGPPGAGKSTLTRLVAAALTRAALVDAHLVGTMIVGGYVWPLGEPAEEAARQVQLLNANVCAVAANFANAGFTPVIDWVVPDAVQLETYRAALAGRRLLLVVLDPGTSVCRSRNAVRAPEEQFFFNGYDELRASMGSYRDVGWWFDTSALSPEETAQRLLDEAVFRAVLPHVEPRG